MIRPPPPPLARSAEIKALIGEVARRHSVSVELIRSRRRSAEIVRARWEAIRLVHERFPALSSPQLGRLFGKDHSTILGVLGRRNGGHSLSRRKRAGNPVNLAG